MEAPYSGPSDIISRNDKFFKFKLPQGETTVSIDRLKPFYWKTVEDSDESMAENAPIEYDSSDVMAPDVVSVIEDDVAGAFFIEPSVISDDTR